MRLLPKRMIEIIIGFSVIILFFVLTSFRAELINQLNNLALPRFIINFISVSAIIAIIGLICLFFKDRLVKDWQDLKQNHYRYFQTYLPYWLFALGLMMVSNFILFFLVGDQDIAENEQVIRETFQAAPIMVYISAVFLAPIIEELVFRGGFYYIFRNKWLFVILSGLAFGAVHVLGATEVDQLLFIIPYTIPGIAFALALYHSKNFYVPIALHFMHNGIIMALQIFVIIVGGDVLV